MTHASNARKCFKENIDLFGNPKTQPEKYNLYNGLLNMADAMQALQDELRRLRQEVDQLRRS